MKKTATTQGQRAEIVNLYLAGLRIKDIMGRLKVGKDIFYETLRAANITLRGSGWKNGCEKTQTPSRRDERRDCLHYYQDGGCLDQAAYADKPAVPCGGCTLFEPGGDPAEYLRLWSEFYLCRGEAVSG